MDKALAKLVDILSAHTKANPHEDFIICVTGDHTTPVKYGDHTSEPVPIILGQASLIDKTVKEGNGKLSYDEIICGKGDSRLGRFNGIEVIPLLKRYRQSVLDNL